MRTPEKVHQSRDADNSALTIIPDGQRHRPGPILHQSELLWLTRYVQALNELAAPLPSRVVLTGPGATGFAQDDLIEITVDHDGDRPLLEIRLAEIAAAKSDLVPSARPNLRVLSREQWNHQRTGEAAGAHHNAWLAPHTAR